MLASTKTSLSLSETKKKFEQLLQSTILCFGHKTPLRDACEYALMNGGKRIRPLIVYLMSDALKRNKEVSSIALSIEYFHTASLIVDDLPCMDNDDFRREKPTVHKVFGEATAILASYALMTAGFEKIYESAQHLAEDAGRACLLVLHEVSRASGIHGITGGQFLDLYPQDMSFEHLLMTIEKKTVKLFEVAFLYGWVFGGGNFSLIGEVKQLGHHFGMAFQIADDLSDCHQDKEKHATANIALRLGKKEAAALLQQELRLFGELLERLKIRTDAFLLLKTRLQEHACT